MHKMSAELEKEILITIPLVAKFIKKKKEISEAEFRSLSSFYRNAFQWARNASLEEIKEFNLKFKDHKIMGEHFNVLLSPEGQEYLKYLHDLTKKYSSK